MYLQVRKTNTIILKYIVPNVLFLVQIQLNSKGVEFCKGNEG